METSEKIDITEFEENYIATTEMPNVCDKEPTTEEKCDDDKLLLKEKYDDCQSVLSDDNNIVDFDFDFTKYNLLMESNKQKEEDNKMKERINKYITQKFRMLWNADKIAEFDINKIYIKCVFFKRNKKCYSIKLTIYYESKIKFAYIYNHTKGYSGFNSTTSLSGSYTVLYSETGPYDNTCLCSYLAETLVEPECIKLKRIIDELFYEYCEFVL